MKKPPKYGNRKVIVDGLSFDSNGEAMHWLYLKSEQKAGRISSLRRQVPIKLEGRDGPIKYDSGRQASIKVDYSYECPRRGLVYADFKGFETRESKLKRAICRAMGIEVEIVK